MAKADFCFTFYDGDATREMAHMNRLERGAYMDVVIQQRQRGPLSRDDIKKFLSKDFDIVWPALEWVLKKDPAGKFFIEWLATSEEKAQKHSKKQSSNRTKRQPKPNLVLPKTDLVVPLGDGDGDGDVEEKLKGALDEIFIEQLRMKWKDVDFNRELESFKDKVRGSPDHYEEHDTGGIKLAFQSQLRYAKKNDRHTGKGKINGTPGAKFSGDYSEPI